MSVVLEWSCYTSSSEYTLQPVGLRPIIEVRVDLMVEATILKKNWTFLVLNLTDMPKARKVGTDSKN